MLSHSKKSWAIIGAGPAGMMEALLLATVFPHRQINVVDRYRQHVRGHGLQLLNDTTRNMIVCLDSIKVATTKILQAKHIDPDERKNYQQVLINIEKTKKFFLKNFTGFITGPFIRTHVITDMLREFVQEELGSNKVKFFMENEVKKEHLQALVDGNAPINNLSSASDRQTHTILQDAEFIFGADGSHSLVREIIFGEKDEDLPKDNLAYVIELKLEMKGISSSLDVFKKTIYPTLVNGHLHVWSQGYSGTATLHVFVDKEQYDLLKSKNANNMALGEFTNPYRRLADLPLSMRKAINGSIESVVGLENFDENSLKITTLPMGTYAAKKLVTHVNGRGYGLVGDSGIGLVLERGVNNGLYSAAQYALALFKQDLTNKFVRAQPMISSYLTFKALHEQRIAEFILTLKEQYQLSLADEKIIQKKYLKFFYKLMATPILCHSRHVEFVTKAELAFLRRLTTMIGKHTKKNITLTANSLFADLKNNETVLNNQKNDLDLCEDKIKLRAVKVKAEIKIKFGFINFIKNLYGRFVSLYFSMKDKHFVAVYPTGRQPVLTDKLAELNNKLPGFNYVTQREQYMKSAEWIFNMDRLSLYLHDQIAKINRSSKPNHKKLSTLSSFLEATIEFSDKMSSLMAANSPNTLQMQDAIHVWQSKLNGMKLAANPLVKSALRSSWKATLNIDNVSEQVIAGFDAYLNAAPKTVYTKQLGLFKGGLAMKVGSYQWLFKNPSLSNLARLCIIHSLLADTGNKDLRLSIVKLFPSAAHVSINEVRDEILKIVKMQVQPLKLVEFNRAALALANCVLANGFPSAEMVARLDAVFVGSDQVENRFCC